jgi:DNA-binding MurR/RpiR family transcriptional regulator
MEAQQLELNHSEAYKKLSPGQQQLVRLLAEPTNAMMKAAEAAKVLGVGAATVSRWRNDATFQTALEEYQKALGRTWLQGKRFEADQRLWDVITNKDTPNKELLTALELFYKVTGTLQQAAREVPTEYNGIKIVFEERGAASEPVQVVEVKGE